MKKLIVLLSFLLVFSFGFGAIGWAGNLYPTSGSELPNGADIYVYCQIWKDGVTDSPGKGDGITSTLYYKKSGDVAYNPTTMTYNVDIDNNDEYVGIIPSTFFSTDDILDFYCLVSDGVDYDPAPGGTYTIVAGLNHAVTVTFSVYMGSTSSYSGGVSLLGSSSPLTWVAGDFQMTDPDEDLIYTVDVEFPAGTNPSLEYKYMKNNGETWDWEGVDGNRLLTIDDSSPTQTLDPINTFGIKNTDYANGWFDDYITISKNGSGSTFNLDGSGTPLDGHDFGAVSSLVITDCDMKYWSNTIDRSGGAFGYKIMSEDGNTQIVAPVLTNWDQTKLTGNDYQGTKSDLSINLLSGLEDATTYQLHVWAKSDGVVQGESYLSNNSANYVATFTTPDGQVPITLASFSAAALNGCVSVTWVTESESENAHFLLYRDGEVIAQIAGAGTSSEPHSYAYTDRYVVPGRTYTYQLADVSFDGGETKHNEVEVELKAEGVDRDYTIGAAYPNPFNPLTMVPVNLAKEAVVTATLYDISGRPLTELHNGTLSAGSHAITIDGANLSTGIYFVRVRVNDATHVQKIALMK